MEDAILIWCNENFTFTYLVAIYLSHPVDGIKRGGGGGGGGSGKKWSKFRRKWMSTVGERGRGSAEVRCPEL